MKRSLIALLCLLVLAAIPVLAHGGEEEPHAPPRPLLLKLFPLATSFPAREMKLSAAARARIEKSLSTKLEGHDLTADLYIPTAKGRSIGLAWMTDVHLGGKEGDVIVGMDLMGRVVGVLLQHSPVAALNDASFLAQFKGKTASSSFTVKAAPGQPAASKQLASAVRKAVLIMAETLKPAGG